MFITDFTHDLQSMYQLVTEKQNRSTLVEYQSLHAHISASFLAALWKKDDRCLGKLSKRLNWTIFNSEH